MTVIPFDTLKLADRLKAGGFSTEQAHMIVSAVAEAIADSELVTKAELAAVRAEIAEVKCEMACVRSETKTVIAEAKCDVHRYLLWLTVGCCAIVNAVVIAGAAYGLSGMAGH